MKDFLKEAKHWVPVMVLLSTPLFLLLIGCEGKVTSTTPANCRRLAMPTGCPDVYVTKDGERDVYVTDKGGICVCENGKVTKGSSPPADQSHAEDGGGK